MWGAPLEKRFTISVGVMCFVILEKRFTISVGVMCFVILFFNLFTLVIFMKVDNISSHCRCLC